MSLEDLKAFFSEEDKEDIETIKDNEKKGTKPILTATITRQKEERERYHEIGENIKKSEKLRAKINNDIKNEASRDVILNDCIKCIGSMTRDIVFYK